MAEKSYDCCKCGACCIVGLDVLLTLGESSYFETRADLVQLTVLYQGRFHPAPRFMRQVEGGRCAALEGELRNCRCTIYGERPSLCREFEAGSEDCLAARQKLGFDAPAPKSDSAES